MILNSIISSFNSDHNKKLEKLIYDAVYVSEATAIACYPMIGKGDEKGADNAAVETMRTSLNKVAISGRIVIGEGERDEAPMLYIGEEVGCGGISVDIAVDPLEGTTLCANASPNSLVTMAIGEEGSILNAPDLYMDKIAVGISGFPHDILNLDNSYESNLKEIAKFKNCDMSDLGVMILKRPRHEELIAKVREAGARIYLIEDGDIAAAIATTNPQKTGIDVYMGIGGAPEGVLAAAALKIHGGHFLGRLLSSTEEQQKRIKEMGIQDITKQYNATEMIKGDVIFVATGVTDGNLLKGVRIKGNAIYTNSIVMHFATRTIRNVSNKILVN